MGRRVFTNNSEGLAKMKALSETEISTLTIDEDDKMGSVAAYMALIKGYCAINILVLPK